MRTLFILLSSLYIFSSVHAQNTNTLSTALSELDKEMGGHQAANFVFKKASKTPGCVFPDAPDYAAPNWVCDDYIIGYELSAVGYAEKRVLDRDVITKSDINGDFINKIDPMIKAYINGVLQLKEEFDVHVNLMIQRYLEKNPAKTKSTQMPKVQKQITTFDSQSHRLNIKRLLKSYIEYGKDNKVVDKINTQITKLTYKGDDCQMLIKNYVSVDAKDSLTSSEQTISRGVCHTHQLIRETESSGYDLIRVIKSPKGAYFALVGINKEKLSETTKGALQSSVEKDRELWRQFKAKKSNDALQKEINEITNDK